MTMKFLKATQDANGIGYQIWLDTSKTDADGNPDPNYVRDYTWTPNDQTQTELSDTQYQTMTINEAKLLAQHDLAQMQAPNPAPTDLSVNGSTF